jgi:hypothetical protein
MSSFVPVRNYVAHLDLQRSHHIAWLQAVLERLAALDPSAFARDGELHAIWAALTPPKPAQPSARPLEPLLALIRSGEGSYESVNRGRAGDTPGGWKGLTAMTVAQVMQAQADGHVFAVGAYQFIPSTLKIAVDVAKVAGNVAFSPEAQDRLAEVLILGGKRPALRDYLIGKANSIEAAQLDLAREWAAIPGPNGRGVYDGDRAGNRAGLSVGATQAALMAARANVLGAAAPAPAPKPTVTPKSPFSTKLTPHITLGEFALGQEARRFQHQYQVDTALRLAQFLEEVRIQFGGKPVYITSGYRPPEINRVQGGDPNSEHLYKMPEWGAVDFHIPGADMAAVQRWVLEKWPESVGKGWPKRGFIHLGIGWRKARGFRVWDY